MTWLRGAACFVSGIVLTVACVTSEVSRINDADYPPKAKDCPIKIFPSTTPDYEWEDIASVKAHCHGAVGRDACVQQIREDACALGGDTVYGFTDGESGEAIVLIATVAIKTGNAREKTGETPSKPPAAEEPTVAGGCSPPCSPGYACTDGTCTGLCNPPCPEGARCNQQRMCEAILPAAAPPAAAPPATDSP